VRTGADGVENMVAANLHRTLPLSREAGSQIG
jgi:hypothetical protein